MSFTDQHLYFDDVEVGQEWQSPGRTVTEADIVNFAGLSGDFNAVHIDHEFARSTPFGQPIAHGLLGLAMASGLGVHSPAMRTLAIVCLREWHFREPVFIGDTIRVHCRLLEKAVRGRGRRALLSWQRQVINQHGKVVQEGISQTLVEGRAASRSQGEPESPAESTPTANAKKSHEAPE